jgi:hypothetical protein
MDPQVTQNQRFGAASRGAVRGFGSRFPLHLLNLRSASLDSPSVSGICPPTQDQAKTARLAEEADDYVLNRSKVASAVEFRCSALGQRQLGGCTATQTRHSSTNSHIDAPPRPICSSPLQSVTSARRVRNPLMSGISCQAGGQAAVPRATFLPGELGGSAAPHPADPVHPCTALPAVPRRAWRFR